MQAVTHNKKFYQQTWFVIIALLVFAPLGLYLAWAKTDWPKWAKIVATVAVATLFMYAYASNSDKDKQSSTSGKNNSSQTDSKAANKPVIGVNNAKYVDNILTLSEEDADTTFTVKTGNLSGKADETTLTVNGVTISPSLTNHYSYSTTLKPGDNTFNIVATNKAGKDEKKLVVTYKPKTATSSESKSSTQTTPAPVATTDSTIFEAEITCQEYAEKQLGVNDINVHYDQSSIKKKNADGTIIIKVNIADSQGFFKPEKPLGIMECTTDSTGMKVNNFIHY